MISNDDKKTDSNNAAQNNEEQTPLPVHNPLNDGDDRKITQEDVDNEQKFKEALTERD